MHFFAESVSSLLFPSHCIHCKGELPLSIHHLCPSCLELLELIDPLSRCAICFSKSCICKKEPIIADRQAFCFDYEGPAKSLLVAFKYGDKPYLAKSLAAFMLFQYERLGWQFPDAITYIPQSFLRATIRGYNQSALLAKELAKLMNRPLFDLLKRSNFNITQTLLPKEERKRLSPTTFLCKNEAAIQGKEILLIDDVSTTGTTLLHASQALKNLNPKQLDVLCLLHTEL